MKAKNFGHLVVQLHSFEIQRKSRIDFWSQQHFKECGTFLTSERYRDDLDKMRREIQIISGKLDALTVSRQETEDESKFPKQITKAQPKRSTKIR